MRTFLNARQQLAALFVAGLLMRVFVLLTSAGTSDVWLWRHFAAIVSEESILLGYERHSLLNHPPLALLLLRGLDSVSRTLSVDLGFVVRASQVTADCAMFAVLLALLYVDHERRALAAIYFLSPVTVLVASHHVNTDSLLMLLVSMALAMLVARHDIAAGAVLGLAGGIKLIAIFPIPMLLFALGFKRGSRFGAAASLGLAVWVVPLFVGGSSTAVAQVLGYRGAGVPWSTSLASTLLGRAAALMPGGREKGYNTMLYALSTTFSSWQLAFTLTAIAASAYVAYRIRRSSRDTCAIVAGAFVCYLFILVSASMVAVHYVVWSLPFLPIVASKRFIVLVHAALSSYLLAVYAITWTHSFPIYSDLGHSTWTPMTTHALELANLFGWAICASVTAAALQRLVIKPELRYCRRFCREQPSMTEDATLRTR